MLDRETEIAKFNKNKSTEFQFNSQAKSQDENPALIKQQAEIDVILQYKAETLQRYPAGLPGLTDCFEGLEEYRDIQPSDAHKFLVREKILDNYNSLIIKSCIQESEANHSSDLHCYGCHLTRFPGELIPAYRDYFAQVLVLLLDYNHLTEIPAELCQLGLLRLDLSSNHLREIPADLGQVGLLQELHLENNHLATIPAELDQLRTLRELWLDFNHLTTLPDNLREDILRSRTYTRPTKDLVLGIQTRPSAESKKSPRP